MNKKLAPIALFTYNRLNHTRQTIEALKKNELAKESELFIYNDGGKDDESWRQVKEVRKYLKTINGFRNISIIEQEKNLGLAKSIISGVTEIISIYDKVIVLEDDIVTSLYFLNFMNKVLEFYEHEKKVWHVSGYTHPVDINISEDLFLWRRMDCWGWATWKDRWKYFEKNIDKTIQQFSENDIFRFNLDGTHNSWNQVILNQQGRLNTWAIFWYTTIFKNDGLCVSPKQSYVKNIGLDGSGINCGVDKFLDKTKLNEKENIILTNDITENIIALNAIKKFNNIRQGKINE